MVVVVAVFVAVNIGRYIGYLLYSIIYIGFRIGENFSTQKLRKEGKKTFDKCRNMFKTSGGTTKIRIRPTKLHSPLLFPQFPYSIKRGRSLRLKGRQDCLVVPTFKWEAWAFNGISIYFAFVLWLLPSKKFVALGSNPTWRKTSNTKS